MSNGDQQNPEDEFLRRVNELKGDTNSLKELKREKVDAFSQLIIDVFPPITKLVEQVTMGKRFNAENISTYKKSLENYTKIVAVLVDIQKKIDSIVFEQIKDTILASVAGVKNINTKISKKLEANRLAFFFKYMNEPTANSKIRKIKLKEAKINYAGEPPLFTELIDLIENIGNFIKQQTYDNAFTTENGTGITTLKNNVTSDLNRGYEKGGGQLTVIAQKAQRLMSSREGKVIPRLNPGFVELKKQVSLLSQRAPSPTNGNNQIQSKVKELGELLRNNPTLVNEIRSINSAIDNANIAALTAYASAANGTPIPDKFKNMEIAKIDSFIQRIKERQPPTTTVNGVTVGTVEPEDEEGGGGAPPAAAAAPPPEEASTSAATTPPEEASTSAAAAAPPPEEA